MFLSVMWKTPKWLQFLICCIVANGTLQICDAKFDWGLHYWTMGWLGIPIGLVLFAVLWIIWLNRVAAFARKHSKLDWSEEGRKKW
jgi:hypothetical protein